MAVVLKFGKSCFVEMLLSAHFPWLHCFFETTSFAYVGECVPEARPARQARHRPATSATLQVLSSCSRQFLLALQASVRTSSPPGRLS